MFEKFNILNFPNLTKISTCAYHCWKFTCSETQLPTFTPLFENLKVHWFVYTIWWVVNKSYEYRKFSKVCHNKVNTFSFFRTLWRNSVRFLLMELLWVKNGGSDIHLETIELWSKRIENGFCKIDSQITWSCNISS